MAQLIQKTGVILSIVLLSFSVCYAYDFEVDGIYYDVISLPELTCKVVVGDQEYNGDIVIPSEVSYKNRTLKVISIGTAFKENNKLTSIILPSSITKIENYAFYGCSSLTSIEIPNSVTEIGSSAFYGCSSLTSVEIPNSVTEIGELAFGHCRSLISIEISNSVTEIGRYAFHGCSSLTSVEIPNSVTEIGHSAFGYCSSLTSIEIPNSVTEIGSGAFYDCTMLKNIKLSDNLERIKSGTFANCESLESIAIPGSIEKIEQYISYWGYNIDELTFDNCSNLKKIRFESNKEPLKLGYNYGSYWEECRATNWTDTLETIYIDRRLNYPISYLKSLEEIVIGDNLDEVDIEIKNAEKLTTITSYAIVPPKIPTCTNSQYMDVKVRVPNEALEAYRQADGWKNFWDLEGFDADSGIIDASVVKEKTEVGRYNLLGAPVSENYEGIVIVRYSDGSTKKFNK